MVALPRNAATFFRLFYLSHFAKTPVLSISLSLLIYSFPRFPNVARYVVIDM